MGVAGGGIRFHHHDVNGCQRAKSDIRVNKYNICVCPGSESNRNQLMKKLIEGLMPAGADKLLLVSFHLLYGLIFFCV